MTKLPHKVSPDRLANNQTTYESTILLKDLPHLSSLLPKQATEIHVVLQFHRDENNRILIDLFLNTTLQLLCQRDLALYTQLFEIHTQLSPIEDDREAEYLPEHIDPVMLENRQLDLMRMIEEELILALPLVPKKDDNNDCVQPENSVNCDDFETADQASRTHPFKGLDKLIKSKKGD